MGGKGSSKKKEVELPKKETKKKMVKKYKCLIKGQSQIFNTQEAARDMALSVLNTGNIFFLELSQVEVEDC